MRAEENWQRVEELFFACGELAEEARHPFLDEACSSDRALRQRVECLLAASDSVGDRFERVVREAATIEVEAADLPPSAALGPFRLLEVLGEGGMGEVYLGERADGAYHQRVAIKVVKGGLIGPLVERRFERERQILARLEHPAVARLLDGGTTPEGRPYLVMEYVDGEPIDVFCDHHQLPISSRLELFRKVCTGVQVAHSSLVVHRDIKPSNILVTVDGRPKLLDFGISKLLEDGDAAESTALTILGQRVLTPEYASPEQVREEPITTAVDVYALGLLLHRLLTGDRPYAVPTTRGEELRKAICDTPPERPSATVARLATADPARCKAIAAARATEPGRLRRRLSGDLDHILAKALRKEPNERYGSVEQLSADIDRHLQGLPIEARRGGWRYRTGRYLRRHRVGVTAGASTVLALAIGLVGQMRATQRANRETARANLEARSSAQVADFLVRLFDASDPTRTRDVLTARQLLDRGVERIQKELTDQPLVQARLMSTLGRVYHNRGLFAEAEPLFATSLERRLQHLPPGHPDIATSELDLADDLRVQGRVKEAMPHYEQAVSIRRAHFGSDSIELAEALNNMALGLLRTADYDRAGALLQTAFEIRKRRLGDDYLVSQSLHNLTLLAILRGDYRTAVATGREALALRSRVIAPDHPSRGRTLALLAGPVRELGDYAEAERLLRAALDIMRKSWGDYHVDVLGTEGDLAYVRHLEGDWATAEATQRKVLELEREHLGPDHREVAITLDHLGRQLADRGDLDGAEGFLRRSLELRARIYPADHPSVAEGRYRLGRLLLRRRKVKEAEPLLREALTARRKALPATHPDVGDSLLGVAELLRLQGSPSAATPLAEEGLSILRQALPPNHLRIADAQAILGECLLGERRFDASETALLASHHGFSQRLGADAAPTRDARARLARLYHEWGRPSAAAQYEGGHVP